MSEYFQSIFSNTFVFVKEVVVFLFTVGWYLLVTVIILVVVRFLWRLYLKTIQEDFVKDQDWSFLSIRVPKVNQSSLQAMEQVFAQIHAIISSSTFAKKYFEGVVPLWYSLEIVSLGGKISFIIRCPRKHKQLIQSAIYAQYPEAEVTEVGDYLENLSLENIQQSLEIWGTELKLNNEDSLPIKTYRDFEHESGAEKMVDPLRAVFESLANIGPSEFFAIQILIQPIKDSAWKPKGEAKAKELMTGEQNHKKTLSVFSAFLKLFKKSHASITQERNFTTLSDVEKDAVNSVLKKVGKPGYMSLVRMLYLAPRESYGKAKFSLFIGAFETVSSANTNGFKLNAEATPKLEYKISESMEKPYIEYVISKRRMRLVQSFRERSYGLLTKPYTLNIEELATIYHLPLVSETDAPSTGVETVATRKSQPPSNLPIGEY